MCAPPLLAIYNNYSYKQAISLTTGVVQVAREPEACVQGVVDFYCISWYGRIHALSTTVYWISRSLCLLTPINSNLPLCVEVTRLESWLVLWSMTHTVVLGSVREFILYGHYSSTWEWSSLADLARWRTANSRWWLDEASRHFKNRSGLFVILFQAKEAEVSEHTISLKKIH